MAKRENKEFCVVILSHGRCDIMKTYDMLRNQNYTGRIFVLIDDEDETAEDYKRKYGDDCIQFNKREAEAITDTGDLVDHRKAVVFARNAVFDKIKEQGYTYFLVLDDDYQDFRVQFDQDFYYIYKDIKAYNLDRYFEIILDYYKSIPAETISLSQTGDYFGGKTGNYGDAIKTKRKVMNTFFCSVDRLFKFFGRINEDVNYYTVAGRQGRLCFQINQLSILQAQTQANEGGLTDIYKALGTYVKSFYSVMYSPSCVKVITMGSKERRLHHEIKWDACAAKILDKKYKKTTA